MWEHAPRAPDRSPAVDVCALCVPREHTAQAQQVSTVTVVSTRVFPNDKGKARCGYRSTPLCHRRSILIAPPQRVLCVDKVFLPMA